MPTPSTPAFRHSLIRTLLVAFIAAAGAFVAGSAFAADAPGTALAANNCSPAGELRGDADRGAMLHVKHCAECHGADGRADMLVRHLDKIPADQSDPVVMQTFPDAFLYLAICKGGEAVGKDVMMPPWGDLLSDQDIRDLIAHIRSFSGT